MPKRNRSLGMLVFLIALGVSLSVTPFPVFVSAGDELVEKVELSWSGGGTAGWTMESTYSGDWAINLTAPGQAVWNSTSGIGEGVSEGRVILILVPGTTLGDIESISWWVNTTNGYPPHVDLILDVDGDGSFDGGKKDLVTGQALSGSDDILVAEFAYQPYVGPGYVYSSPGVPYGHYDPGLQGSHYNPTYGIWVQTFQNDTAELGTTEFNNDTVCWLYSGLPGPYAVGAGGYFGTLEDFKEKAVQVIGGTDYAPVNSSTVVLEIQIEVDNWLGGAEALIDDLSLNGELLLTELLPPEIVVVNPESKTYEPGDVPVEITASDIFGVDQVWFNVKEIGGDWLYSDNQTYTGTTSMKDMDVGDYRFYAWANNTLGLVEINSQTLFTVSVRELTVDIHPKTLNLKSKGRWVTVIITFSEGYFAQEIDIESIQLEVGTEAIPAVWGKAFDGVVMVKFSRSALQELVEPGEEVEVTVTGETLDDESFEESDTIRVINPGKNKGGNGEKPGKGQENKNQNGPNMNWNWGWQKGNNGKSQKNKKGGKK